MLRELTDIDWEDTTESVPAAVTALLMPLTYSIANGVAFGFITYVALKLMTGRVKQVSAIAGVISSVFLFKFIYLGAG
jgi:AGZA family xanthine/uracil permease-like MFS transporter